MSFMNSSNKVIKTGIFKFLIGVFIFLGLWSGVLKAQQLTYKKAFISDEYSKAIQSARSLVDSLRKAQHIPGVEVAVSVKGQKVWSQGFGYADLENKVPV